MSEQLCTIAPGEHAEETIMLCMACTFVHTISAGGVGNKPVSFGDRSLKLVGYRL